MKKTMLKLSGAKVLDKMTQKTINGGAGSGGCCDPAYSCCAPSSQTGPFCITWGNTSCQFVYSRNCCV